MSAQGGCTPALVVGAMIHHPRIWPAHVTVAELREAFADDHLHAALVVDGATLLAVVVRDDIATGPAADPARRHGHLGERTVGPGDDVAQVWTRMVREGVRRLAVVDHDTTLLGLLCLKRSGHGFCRDADVAARAGGRAPVPVGELTPPRALLGQAVRG